MTSENGHHHPTHLTLSFEFTLYPPAITTITTTFAYRNQALHCFSSYRILVRHSERHVRLLILLLVILVSSSHVSDIWLVK
jgi:hypothetical protein